MRKHRLGINYLLLLMILIATTASAQSGPILQTITQNLVIGGQAVLTGTGFGSSQGIGYVSLQGKAGIVEKPSDWTDTKITVTVAPGTIQGYAYVEQNSIEGNNVFYSMKPPQLNRITQNLVIGGKAVLTGTGFGSSQGIGYVSLDGKQGIVKNPADWTDTQITVTVPPEIWSGAAFVQQNGAEGNNVQFTMQPPLVLALTAPFCLGGDQSCNSSYISSFIQNELPHLSGIVVTVPWNEIDKNCTDSSNPPVARCTTVPTTCPELNQTTDYKFCPLDNGIINNYINNAAFAGKKIAFIIAPVSDQALNNSTPSYVFTTNWATELSNQLGKTVNPQDEAVCGAYLGDVGAGSCPVQTIGGGTISTTDTTNFAVWNAESCSVTFSGSPSTNLGCNTANTCTTPYHDYTGFPIPYEIPFLTAYQNFLKAFAQHYNPTSGNSTGQTIAPYIAYVRPGMTSGGENVNFCAIKNNGGLAEDPWRANTQIAAGTIVNTGANGMGGTQYVAIGAGKTGGTSMPTCSTPGCTTAPDGSGGTAVPGWFNTGTWPIAGSTAGISIWPGVKGLASEPSGYTDNGYLTNWGGTTNDGTGYVTEMLQYLKSLNASFSWDTSAHNGPPGTSAGFENNAYADSQAIIASANGIGFGMQSVSVQDTTLNAANAGAYPTTATDWAHNFQTYSAPVHHLQDYHPGNPYFAAGYTITNIAVQQGGGPNGTNLATIHCSSTIQPPFSDCSPYNGGPIYISGNSQFNAQNQNQIQTAIACTGCLSSNTLTFGTTVLPGPYTGGTVWAPDYWPVMMPFATLQGATAIEVPECDLDYTFLSFNSQGLPANNTQTAQWVANETFPNTAGCAQWGVPGPDSTYSGAVANVLNF